MKYEYIDSDTGEDEKKKNSIVAINCRGCGFRFCHENRVILQIEKFPKEKQKTSEPLRSRKSKMIS